MPKFTTLDPSDVAVGRGRNAAEARKPFIEALRAYDAGSIELEQGEKATTVKRLLQDASRQVGKRVRSSWNTQQTVLYWKAVGSRNGGASA